jgi:hypothetical protein
MNVIINHSLILILLSISYCQQERQRNWMSRRTPERTHKSDLGGHGGAKHIETSGQHNLCLLNSKPCHKLRREEPYKVGCPSSSSPILQITKIYHWTHENDLGLIGRSRNFLRALSD